MTNAQRKALLTLASKYRKACKWDQEKAVEAAIRALKQLETITKPKGVPCLQTPTTT